MCVPTVAEKNGGQQQYRVFSHVKNDIQQHCWTEGKECVEEAAMRRRRATGGFKLCNEIGPLRKEHKALD